MAAKGSEKAFCVLTFNECQSVTIVQRVDVCTRITKGAHIKHQAASVV